jgi:hypothetical protein
MVECWCFGNPILSRPDGKSTANMHGTEDDTDISFSGNEHPCCKMVRLTDSRRLSDQNGCEVGSGPDGARCRRCHD